MPEKIIAGRYEVLGACGRGGTSRVLLVRRLTDGKHFAAKIMDPTVSVLDGQREAAILRQIKDPAVPKLEECLIWNGQCVLIMEWREGKTLEQTVAETGKLHLWEMLWLGIRLSALLRKMQEQTPPVFYLDLKPSNILMKPEKRRSENGWRKRNIWRDSSGRRFGSLVDFGCARVADENGAVCSDGVGTEGFAPPEQQLTGQPLTASADVYALAATLRYAAGDLSRSRRLTLVLDRALSQDAEARFPTMKAFQWALLGCMPDIFLKAFPGRRGLLLLIVMGVLALAGNMAGQYSACHWSREIEGCLTAELDEQGESQLYRLLQQPLWTGKTVAETIAPNAALCRKLGRSLWCQGKEVTAKKEGCQWLARGAFSEKEREQYERLAAYYERLDGEEKPEGSEILDAVAVLSWMASEEKDAEVLCVTAKELLRWVYALPEEQLRTAQVSQWLEELCQRLQEAVKKEAGKLVKQDQRQAGQNVTGQNTEEPTAEKKALPDQKVDAHGTDQAAKQKIDQQLQAVLETAEELLELSRMGRNEIA